MQRGRKRNTDTATIAFWGLSIGIMLLVAACGLSVEAATTTALDADSIAAAMTFAPIVTMTPSEPTAQATDPTGTAGMPATPAATARSGCGDDGAPIRYEADVQIDAAAHKLSATLRTTYRNTTGGPLSFLVMNVDANRTPGLFTLDDLSVVQPALVGVEQYALNGPRLEITLDKALPAGCSLAFTQRFALVVPSLANARMAYLSHTDRQLNLGYWLPEIAPYAAGAWQTPKPWMIGEYIKSEVADYVVRAVLHNGGERGAIIGPGTVRRQGDANWEFTLKRARSFTLVVSDAMAHMTTRAQSGVDVDLYYFSKRTSSAEAESGPRYALEVARQMIERLTQLFGPMPYERLVVVEGDFPDGMESSGIVHVSENWFGKYKGQPDSWLTCITAHEVAHQWWFAMVGNDPGETPYLDESLAIYSEVLYLESVQPALLPWWWDFRVNMYQPKGHVDSTVYEYWNVRLYINAVYLRGAQMLQAMRETVGDAAFFAWLREYTQSESGQNATPLEFWRALGQENYQKVAAIRQQYMRQPDVLPATVWQRGQTPPTSSAGEQ